MPQPCRGTVSAVKVVVGDDWGFGGGEGEGKERRGRKAGVIRG